METAGFVCVSAASILLSASQGTVLGSLVGSMLGLSRHGSKVIHSPTLYHIPSANQSPTTPSLKRFFSDTVLTMMLLTVLLTVNNKWMYSQMPL